MDHACRLPAAGLHAVEVQVTAVHMAANHCQTAWELGQLSMTWLRVATCSWQAACGQRSDSGVPLWMCLLLLFFRL